MTPTPASAITAPAAPKWTSGKPILLAPPILHTRALTRHNTSVLAIIAAAPTPRIGTQVTAIPMDVTSIATAWVTRPSTAPVKPSTRTPNLPSSRSSSPLTAASPARSARSSASTCRTARSFQLRLGHQWRHGQRDHERVLRCAEDGFW